MVNYYVLMEFPIDNFTNYSSSVQEYERKLNGIKRNYSDIEEVATDSKKWKTEYYEAKNIVDNKLDIIIDMLSRKGYISQREKEKVLSYGKTRKKNINKDDIILNVLLDDEDKSEGLNSNKYFFENRDEYIDKKLKARGIVTKESEFEEADFSSDDIKKLKESLKKRSDYYDAFYKFFHSKGSTSKLTYMNDFFNMICMENIGKEYSREFGNKSDEDICKISSKRWTEVVTEFSKNYTKSTTDTSEYVRNYISYLSKIPDVVRAYGEYKNIEKVNRIIDEFNSIYKHSGSKERYLLEPVKARYEIIVKKASDVKTFDEICSTLCIFTKPPLPKIEKLDVQQEGKNKIKVKWDIFGVVDDSTSLEIIRNGVMIKSLQKKDILKSSYIDEPPKGYSYTYRIRLVRGKETCEKECNNSFSILPEIKNVNMSGDMGRLSVTYEIDGNMPVVVRKKEGNEAVNEKDGSEISLGSKEFHDSGIELRKKYFYTFFAKIEDGSYAKLETLEYEAQPPKLTNVEKKGELGKLQVKFEVDTKAEIIVCKKINECSQNVTDGTKIPVVLKEFTDSGLELGQRYYYTFFANWGNNNYVKLDTTDFTPLMPRVEGIAKKDKLGNLDVKYEIKTSSDIVVCRKEGASPSSVTDGVKINANIKGFRDADLEIGKKYFYGVFVRWENGKYEKIKNIDHTPGIVWPVINNSDVAVNTFERELSLEFCASEEYDIEVTYCDERGTERNLPHEFIGNKPVKKEYRVKKDDFEFGICYIIRIYLSVKISGKQYRNLAWSYQYKPEKMEMMSMKEEKIVDGKEDFLLKFNVNGSKWPSDKLATDGILIVCVGNTEKINNYKECNNRIEIDFNKYEKEYIYIGKNLLAGGNHWITGFYKNKENVKKIFVHQHLEKVNMVYSVVKEKGAGFLKPARWCISIEYSRLVKRPMLRFEIGTNPDYQLDIEAGDSSVTSEKIYFDVYEKDKSKQKNLTNLLGGNPLYYLKCVNAEDKSIYNIQVQ